MLLLKENVFSVTTAKVQKKEKFELFIGSSSPENSSIVTIFNIL